MLLLWDVILFVVSSAIIFYVYGLWGRDYFQKRGVKCLPYRSSIIGNMFKVLVKQEHMKDRIKIGYDQFHNQRYFGFMQMSKPQIVLRDPDLIKQITVKDYDSFQDHHGFVDENTDPLFGKNLFALKGEKWREMRATLSPTFTSSKMRGMFGLVTDCAKRFTNFYMEKAKQNMRGGRNVIDVEMKDIFTRCGNDIIASAAFGIHVDSLENDKNEFYVMGKEATNFGGAQYLKLLLFVSFPKLMKFFGLKLYKEKVNTFFSRLVTSAIKEREERNIVRPDMIHLLMQARKGALKYEQENTKEAGFATVEESDIGKQTIKKQWTDDDITAQAILFLIAGFDTTAQILSFFAYELANNKYFFGKLQEEVDSIVKEKGFNLDYEDLPRLKYMDMFLSETMRLWPAVVNIDRLCNKTYQLPPPNNGRQGYTIEPGSVIFVPVYSIHRDPKYYKNPDVFDPERFSDENKHNVKPFTYMPFGVGPRNCIGSRFALMEVKAVMFFLLAKFNIVITEKTAIPLTMLNTNLTLHPKEGFWLGLQPRAT